MNYSTYASRVTQLDSITLDSELEKLLKGQLNGILSKIRGNNWTQEAELLLSFVIWKFSVFDKNCTIGQKLLGLEYPSIAKNRLICLFILDNFLPYIRNKISKFITPRFELLWKLLENCVKACQLLNLFVFLVQNRYPSLSLRIARLPIQSMPGRSQSSVDYSFQFRELLWHQFGDILMVLVPLINTRAIMSIFSKPAFSSQNISGPGAASDAIQSNFRCCFCKEDPTIPTKLGNCTFCYFCLKANQKSNPNFTCSEH